MLWNLGKFETEFEEKCNGEHLGMLVEIFGQPLLLPHLIDNKLKTVSRLMRGGSWWFPPLLTYLHIPLNARNSHLNPLILLLANTQSFLPIVSPCDKDVGLLLS